MLAYQLDPQVESYLAIRFTLTGVGGGVLARVMLPSAGA